MNWGALKQTKRANSLIYWFILPLGIMQNSNLVSKFMDMHSFTIVS